MLTSLNFTCVTKTKDENHTTEHYASLYLVKNRTESYSHILLNC